MCMYCCHMDIPADHLMKTHNAWCVSFTWELWIYMPTGYTTDVIPLICNDDRTLCLYLQGQTLRGTVGTFTAEGATVIPELSWTQVAMRFDAEGTSFVGDTSIRFITLYNCYVISYKPYVHMIINSLLLVQAATLTCT